MHILQLPSAFFTKTGLDIQGEYSLFLADRGDQRVGIEGPLVETEPLVMGFLPIVTTDPVKMDGYLISSGKLGAIGPRLFDRI
ncbi:hypothetical protein Tco_0998160 [Tanacetum coccineum]